MASVATARIGGAKVWWEGDSASAEGVKPTTLTGRESFAYTYLQIEFIYPKKRNLHSFLPVAARRCRSKCFMKNLWGTTSGF